MSQTVAIILGFWKDEVSSYEAKILPRSEQNKAQGKFLYTSLTPIFDRCEVSELCDL
jgi:hypothetical protein